MSRNNTFDLALVGATGLVGREMLRVLEERDLPIGRLIPVASQRSVGKSLRFRGKDYPVVDIARAIREKPAAALFSAGGECSLQWAPAFADAGIKVIDNSSAWRMNPAHKLVVPEVNADQLGPDDMIIANPNCSTIQMVVALNHLHRDLQIDRIVVSTYQAVTGTGVKAVRQLENEQTGQTVIESAYPHPIFRNVIPHCDVFLDNDYTKEEMKMVNETRKILGDQSLRITATAARVPVLGGHSESINVSFRKAFDMEQVRDILQNTPGVAVVDDPVHNQYPTPLAARGKDWVYVGRVRKDESEKQAINMWVVADNLRKGAATNTVQILEYLWKKNYL